MRLLVSIALALLAVQAKLLEAAPDWSVHASNKEEARKQSVKYEQVNPGTLRGWFKDWMNTYDKTYETKQAEAMAFNNFVKTLRDVQATNQDMAKPWWSSPNQFADMTWQEFSSTVLMQVDPMALETVGGNNRKLIQSGRATSSVRQLLQTLSPASVNWRDSGVVTPVKDQGGCGSCWAFAATSAIESAYLMTQGTLDGLDLSEQQLVSCVNTATGFSGTSGCNGGSSVDVINYVTNVNQTTEARWPYTATTGTCSSSLLATSSLQAVELSNGPWFVTTKSATALMKAVDIQPIIIYFSVQSGFNQYAGGIYSPNITECQTTVNHAIVVVGYNWTGDLTTSYWLVKNSWGPTWGEQGYVHVSMWADGTDGACMMYTYEHAPNLAFTKTFHAMPPPPNPPSPRPPSPPPPPAGKSSKKGRVLYEL